MKRVGQVFVVLLASCVGAACPPILQITLFNNSGEVIEVYAAGDSMKIAPGKFDNFNYPFERDNGVFRLSSSGCEYLYESNYPPDYRQPGFSPRGIQMQVEKDFSITLLPVTYTGDVPGEAAFQAEGFPLRPVSRKCR